MVNTLSNEEWAAVAILRTVAKLAIKNNVVAVVVTVDKALEIAQKLLDRSRTVPQELTEKIRAAALEEAAQEAEKTMAGYLCPYGRDKPGDPTWSHTDEDPCPVCGGNGETSLFKCHDRVSGRIAANIRALGRSP